jgi:hypothetical protein
MASGQCHLQRRRNCVNNKGDFVENHLTFIKDVPMMCVNFVTIVVAKKRSMRQYFRTAPCSFPTCYMCTGALTAVRDCSMETFSNQNVLCIF